MRPLKRIWDVIVGCVMIVLSAAFQFIFFALLLLPALGIASLIVSKENSNLVAYLFAGGVIFLLNVVAFFEYFRRRRLAVMGSGAHKFKGLAQPDSLHIAAIICLTPRGVDRIIYGRELTESVIAAGGVVTAKKN